MRKYYKSLSERECRGYAAIEAAKLATGGRKYVMKLFGMSYKRLLRGIKEISAEEFARADAGRIRLVGGGRKKNPRIS